VVLAPSEELASACPVKVDDQTGLVEYGGALPYLHRKNLVEEIQRFADVPVFVDNDAKAAGTG